MTLPDIDKIVADIIATTLAGKSFTDSIQEYLTKLTNQIHTYINKETVKQLEETAKLSYDAGYKNAIASILTPDYKQGYRDGYAACDEYHNNNRNWETFKPGDMK